MKYYEHLCLIYSFMSIVLDVRLRNQINVKFISAHLRVLMKRGLTCKAVFVEHRLNICIPNSVINHKLTGLMSLTLGESVITGFCPARKRSLRKSRVESALLSTRGIMIDT